MTKKTATKARRDFLEFELEEKYLRIDKLIGQRRHELELKYEQKKLTIPGGSDIGASRSGTRCNPDEQSVISYAGDRVIQRLEEFQNAVDQLLSKLEPDDKKIFYLRFGEHTKYDWVSIWYIMKRGETGYLYKHQKQIYRRREVILDAFAELFLM